MNKSSLTDTIVAPATTPGTGAISIVRMSGPDCFRIADAVVQLKSGTISQSKAYTIHYGDVQGLDDVLVSVFRAPHSYTGEDAVEISCHASSYILTELVNRLLQAGARFAEPGEFTRRAFLNGKMDLAQAEAVADVISSTSAASHRVAFNQLKGRVSSELGSIREQLLELASLLELELDFSEEDVEFADREKLLGLMVSAKDHVDRLAASFRLGNMIKSGVPVAIAGPANSGKSTLLNALLGEERALVSDIPGTTRDSIEETLNLDGILFRFIDTAGIRESDDVVERMGIDRSFRKIYEAEIVLGMLDATLEEVDLLNSLKAWIGQVDMTNQKLFLLLNKVDLVDEETVNNNVNIINKYVTSLGLQYIVIQLSAKTREGLPALQDALVAAEKELIPNADLTFITNTRHLEALQNASLSLTDCITSLTRGISADLVADDLRRVISSINAILGTDLGLDPDTVLNRIFQSHCIGK